VLDHAVGDRIIGAEGAKVDLKGISRDSAGLFSLLPRLPHEDA
jgi:hypothetical protein